MDTKICQDLPYKLLIKFGEFHAIVHVDDKEVTKIIQSEFVNAIEIVKEEVCDLNIYILKKETYCMNYHKDFFFVQYKNGILVCDVKKYGKAYCFYSNLDDSSVFRVSIIKALCVNALHNGIPMIHAALVNISGKGVGIIGYSGSGKSSLAGGLVLRHNGKLVCDDGFFVVTEEEKAYGYGLVPLTGVDLLALQKLNIDVPSHLLPRTDNILESRKRKYINIEEYKKGTYLECSKIDDIIFLVRENSDKLWHRKLDEEEAKKMLREMGVVKMVKDDWNEDDFNNFYNKLSQCNFYLVGMADDYINNIDTIKEWLWS